MKAKIRFLFVVAGILAMLVSACGAVAAETAGGGSKPRAALVEFTGVIEAIDGNQWTVNGQVITIDPSVVQGQFMVGDTIKVEAEVQEDGSVVVTRVELPASVTNDNSNDSNSNDDNSNDSISSNDNSNDDNSNDDDANENASLGGKTPGSSSNSNGDDDDSNDDDSHDDNSNDDSDDDDSDDDDSDDDDGDDD